MDKQFQEMIENLEKEDPKAAELIRDLIASSEKRENYEKECENNAKDATERWKGRLKSCPFCGCVTPHIITTDPWNRYGMYAVECPDCSASTAMCETPDECVEMWNDRAE